MATATMDARTNAIINSMRVKPLDSIFFTVILPSKSDHAYVSCRDKFNTVNLRWISRVPPKDCDVNRFHTLEWIGRYSRWENGCNRNDPLYLEIAYLRILGKRIDPNVIGIACESVVRR